jgi:hypothetical protein
MPLPPCPDCQALTGGELCRRCFVVRLFECVLEEPPDQRTVDRPTAEYVPAGDEAPPDLPDLVPLSPIDEGGMGVVWRVRDLQFQRLLAVKVMRTAQSEERFFAEARITAKLTHPSIVPVHAMGRLADGRPYYTMKLIKGDTLADLLKAGPNVTSRRMEFLQVFVRVCQALAFAHKEGVIHLDLKPSNVMVGEHGEVQVMDWGLAKDLAESDDQPGVAGTWPYMSREQANGRIDEVDRRADVFGLGAMLCAILTGQPPYVGSMEDVKRQARKADLAGAYARLEKCGADAELIKLAKRCLAPERADRPADGAAVEADVEARIQEWLLEAAHKPPPPSTSRFAHPREWARVFWYLAAWRVICHGVMALLLLPLGPAPAAYWAWFIGLHVGTWLPVWWLLRSERGLNPIERGALLNWGATFACDAILFALFCPPWGQASPDEVVRVYSAWPAAHGLWYVAEGRRSWGRFYAVALAYFIAAPLLLFCGLLAPVAYAPAAYALVVGCAMLFLGDSFRRLAAQKAAAGASPPSTGDR